MISLLNSSRIVVFASHSPQLIEEFCNKVLVLDAGQVAFYGPIEDAKRLYPKLC